MTAYRDRYAMRKPSDQEAMNNQLRINQLFHRVFGTAEGQEVLDYICQQICLVDTAPPFDTEPYALAAYNGARFAGLKIAGLALLPYDDSKPEVKG